MKVPEHRLPAATFEDLAMPLFDQLYNFARWLTQDTAEAEDLVQETYAKALRGFSSFQLGTNFRAWMYRILRNSFLSSRTGLKVTVAIDEEADESLLPAESATPESILIAQADREAVQQALAELARTVSRDLAAVRGGGNVVPGNCGNAGHSHRHGHVTPVSREESAARFAAEEEPGGPAWLVSNGAANSMRTSMANSNPRKPTRWRRICEAAHPVPRTHSNGCR